MEVCVSLEDTLSASHCLPSTTLTHASTVSVALLRGKAHSQHGRIRHQGGSGHGGVNHRLGAKLCEVVVRLNASAQSPPTFNTTKSPTFNTTTPSFSCVPTNEL